MGYFPGIATFLERWLSPQLVHVVFLLVAIVVLVLCVSLSVAYLTYLERKVIGYMQLRIGPNRVGIWGLLQPIADAVKLISKEVIVPTKSSPFLFFIAPILSLAPALVAWAVIPFGWRVAIADVNAGLVYVIAVTSLGVYAMVIAGWASNSRYALLGAIRSGAQVVSYEVSMGFSLLCVLLVSGHANLSYIVQHQQLGFFHHHGLNIISWNWIPLFPMFLVYFISGLAETNRHPFDIVEGESEIVAGFHVEYSGMAFALFFLAEYANMMLICAMTALLFLGGWDAPFAILSFIPGFIWFVLKIALLLFVFLWVRATFPRYRYDQIMRLCWRVFLPVTVIWLVLISFLMLTPIHHWL